MWLWLWFVGHPLITMMLFIIASWALVNQVIKIGKWIWFKIFPFTLDDLIDLGKKSHWNYARETVLERESFVTGFSAGYMVGVFFKVKPRMPKK
jgi:hypothetical protein